METLQQVNTIRFIFLTVDKPLVKNSSKLVVYSWLVMAGVL
jgi:hypothetical protein